MFKALIGIFASFAVYSSLASAAGYTYKGEFSSIVVSDPKCEGTIPSGAIEVDIHFLPNGSTVVGKFRVANPTYAGVFAGLVVTGRNGYDEAYLEKKLELNTASYEILLHGPIAPDFVLFEVQIAQTSTSSELSCTARADFYATR